MSVQTQIDRLASAKAAIKTAIEGKGVTVPDATLLDGMAALIESIEAGGGLPTGLSKAAFGTVTLSNGASSIKITHGLGVAPNFVVLFGTSGTPGGSFHMITTYVLYKSSSSITYKYASGYNSSNDLSIGGIYDAVSTSSVLTDTTCTFLRSPYYAGTTSQGARFSTSLYRWIAGVYA